MFWPSRFFQHLSIGWFLSRCAPMHHYTPTPTLPTGTAQGSASSGSQGRGTWSSSWPPWPVGLHTFSSYPALGLGPCEGRGHGPTRGIRGGSGRATEAGLASTMAFPATGKAPGLESPAAQATPTDFFMYKRPQASPVPRKGWAGQKEDFPLGVCPGSNSRHLLNRDPSPCPAPAPVLAPTKCCHPQTSGGGLRVWPPNLLALLPCPGLERGWQARERGTRRWHHTLVALLSDFHPRGHSPSFYSQILNSSSSPPTPQAKAVLCPGGEDSLIKVFRNAGGWRLRRGGCNLENWFQCVFPLWPLGPAGG